MFALVTFLIYVVYYFVIHLYYWNKLEDGVNPVLPFAMDGIVLFVLILISMAIYYMAPSIAARPRSAVPLDRVFLI